MIPLIESNRDTLRELCRRYHVERLELFGSAAEHDVDTDAGDLDFLVSFCDSEDMGPADQYFGLLGDLVALFKRPVDLVCARAMRNPYFIDEVNQSRSLLYAA